MEAKGLINGYDCDACGGTTWTVNADEGVTPMFLGCRATGGCNGRASSRMYRNIPGDVVPAYEWYRLSRREIAKAHQSSREHYRLGGLALRLVK